MPLTIRPDSRVFLNADITTDHDVSGQTIDVALPVSGAAVETWLPAEVVSVVEVPVAGKPSKWVAYYRLLVGPGGGDVVLSVGVYDWTVRLNDVTEAPVIRVDTVKVQL